jgi:hypothetical protein
MISCYNAIAFWSNLDVPTTQCVLCSQESCSLHHILVNCDKALAQGRYTWRHDSVLNFLLPLLTEVVYSHNSTPRPIQGAARGHRQPFVKIDARLRPPKRGSHSSPSSLLDGATDWQLLIEIGKEKIVFPPEIYSTSQRPDIVFWSRSLHKVLLVELTCPAEEGIEAARLRKQARYYHLCRDINNNTSSPWSAILLTIEASARGLFSKSVFAFLKKVGLSNTKARSACKVISTITAKCSLTIYLSHEAEFWNSRRDLLTIEMVHSAPSPPNRVARNEAIRFLSKLEVPTPIHRVLRPNEGRIRVPSSPRRPLEDPRKGLICGKFTSMFSKLACVPEDGPVH